MACPLLFHSYCGICDPLTGYLSIMKNPSEEAKLQNYGAFLQRRAERHAARRCLSCVRSRRWPDIPPIRTTDLYEMFLQTVIDRVQANPALWAVDGDLHHHR